LALKLRFLAVALVIRTIAIHHRSFIADLLPQTVGLERTEEVSFFSLLIFLIPNKSGYGQRVPWLPKT
jgi:hypothetical protein